MEKAACTCNLSEEEFQCLKHQQLQSLQRLRQSTQEQATAVGSLRNELNSFKREYLELLNKLQPVSR